MVKLLRDKIKEALEKPSRTTTVISERERGILTLVETLLSHSDIAREIWGVFPKIYIEYSVSINGLNREQLIKLITEQLEQKHKIEGTQFKEKSLKDLII